MSNSPSRITAIIPSARRAGRFELVVDGAHEATLSLDAIERLALAVGRPYDEVREAVTHEAAALATYDRAVNMLALRARASAELRRSLLRKGEPAPLVDAALERLRDAGFLDDGAFARQFARSKALGSGASRRRLQQELGKRGVARDVGDAAIAEVFVEEAVDEVAMIEAVARKKLRTLARLDPQTRQRRLWAFLARRGYESDSIRRAIETVTGEALADAEADAAADAEGEAGAESSD